jgi:hypothetical protein
MDQPEPPASLAAQLAAGLRARAAWVRERFAEWRMRDDPAPSPAREWRVAAGVAVLLALGPAATMIGANLLTEAARAESRRLQARAAPRVAAEREAESERARLAAALRRPGVGAVIEAAARALPPEAALVRAERDADGLIELEVSTPDPDKLRAALRREPLLAGLRDSGQRQADAAMVVSFREGAE